MSSFVGITIITDLKNAERDVKYLELEIVESMLIGDLDKFELQPNRLKKMGD